MIIISKKQTYKLCTLGVLFFFPLVSSSDAALQDGLTAYWTFDNTLSDTAGSIQGSADTVANDLSFAGSGSGYGTGRFGSNGYLGNGNGWVQTADSPDIDENNGSISVSVWCKVNVFNKNWQAVISKGELSNYRLHRFSNENTVAWAGGQADLGNTSISVNDGQWHHLAATSSSSGGVALYIDGVQVASNGGASTLSNSGNLLMIGNNPDNLSRQWNGEIDDVAIWNRALSSSEISELAGVGGTASSLKDMLTADPSIIDTDSDGLSDEEENTITNTNPGISDSDGDGFLDGHEVAVGTNPNNSADTPPAGSVLSGVSAPGSIGPYLDGQLPSLTPSSSSGDNWQEQNAFPNLSFADLKGVVSEPRSSNIHVIERRGTLQRVNAANLSTSIKTQVMDIGALTENGDNGGLRSVVFHPEFNLAGSPNKAYLYCFYSTTATASRGFSNANGNFFYRLSRFTRNSTGNFPISSELVLIQQYSRDRGQHFGGGLAFDADGFLNISWGDMEFNSSRVGVPFYQDAQRIDRIFQAAVLRIDVDSQGGAISQAPTRTLQGDFGPNAQSGTSRSCPTDHPYYHADNFSGASYMIPKDNYFLNNPPSTLAPNPALSGTPAHGAPLDEHQALGVRNPWRMAVDPVDGHIAMFNVGSNSNTKSLNFEEVEILSPGANFGWPYREGTTSKTFETDRTKAGDAPSGSVLYAPTYVGAEKDAAAFWSHPEGGTVSTGGLFYRGNQWPGISGELIFGDHSTGKIWALDYKNAGAASGTRSKTDGVSVPDNYSVRLLLDSSLAIRQMAAGPSGDEIFIAAGGRIHRLFNNSTPNPEPPALLSATGAFTNLANLTPRAGLIPYTPASTLWSDRAEKFRWIAIPNTAGVSGEYDLLSEKINFTEDWEWIFPVGTVIIKHFALPTDLRDPENPALLQPVETRFLVRGENGSYFYFTYQWRADGSDADLLTSGATADYSIIDEAGSNVNQTWTYPTRANCTDCHQEGAGHVLGLKTRQLNHTQFYPSSGNSANQLATFYSLKLFSNGPALGDLPGMLKSVKIGDSSAPLEDRILSYLDSNCSYCHRPESNAGRAQFNALLTMPLSASGLLNEPPHAGNLDVANSALIVPGDADRSIVFLRDSSVGEERMPPIGRDLSDPHYIPHLRDWIERLGYSGFDAWANGRSIEGGLMDDDDGDQIANVIEYTLGLDEANNSPANLPRVLDPATSSATEDGVRRIRLMDDEKVFLRYGVATP